MFVILFGVSMDYHVFIRSRVREAFDRGLTIVPAHAPRTDHSFSPGRPRRPGHPLANP
jgi:uncharacterized membrane protein YdfJ with MMPL/SSD domain